ncbi:hypothetical protein LTR54_003968 [Friedmanniomyces endolithicus]|nr:hypothetical protein LTR54_003968 [Friedmanniomyces endolithicus]
MAYFYRGPQSPREEQQVPIYTNPLSPPRNPNRLSGSMASASSMRNGLTRRFTTNNELPPTALSPIGQQRKQAAGDYTRSSGCQRILRGGVEEELVLAVKTKRLKG